MSIKFIPHYATIWREFYQRRTILYFMVGQEGTHHYRDSISLLEIGRVLPLGLTNVLFSPVVPRQTNVECPAPGDAIIILGRPWHYGSAMMQEWIDSRLFPPLHIHFVSNDPKHKGYRTVECGLTATSYAAPPFDEKEAVEDYALIHFGRVRVYENEEPCPCLILCGTSTLGTWGATVFATSSELLEKHIGYSGWFQGILNAAVRLPKPGAPFQRTHLAVHVTASFFRPAWVRVNYFSCEKTDGNQWRKGANFEVFVNGKLVANTARDNWRCFIALALEQQDRPGQFIRLWEIVSRLRREFSPAALEERILKERIVKKKTLNPSRSLEEVRQQLIPHGVHFERTHAGEYRLLLSGFEETVL